jgi:hypothetical protein
MDAGTRYSNRFIGTFEPFYSRQDNPIMYRKIHYWMWRYIIRAFACKCGSKKNMNMALKKDKPYDFNIDNFEPLCNSCNQKQDWTIEKSIKHKSRTSKTFASEEYRNQQSERIKKAWKDGKFENRNEENMVWNK